MHWFFSANLQPGIFEFDREESKHIARALRLKNGNRIALTDGAGRIYTGIIVSDDQKKCVAQVLSDYESVAPPPVNVHIAVAPTKNIARLEWFVEKATETGIHEITPIRCDHSERTGIKIDRLKKITIAAIKQSQQPWLPVINDLTEFDDVIQKPFDGQRFIAYLDERNPLNLLKHAYRPGSNVTVLIGPEGDFSKSEIDAAIQAGYVPISLGKNRLRTETAAMAACFTIGLINQ